MQYLDKRTCHFYFYCLLCLNWPELIVSTTQECAQTSIKGYNLHLSITSVPVSHRVFNMAPHGNQLSDDLRKRIVALHKDGLGYKKIHQTLKVNRNTVVKVINRYAKTGSTQNRSRSGRPRKLTPRAERLARKLALQDRRRAAGSIAEEIHTATGVSVSSQTVRRTLHDAGLRGRQPRRKPLLQVCHKRARKQFAIDNQSQTMDYWNHVLWSDETKINLFGSDGVQHVWRRPGEE